MFARVEDKGNNTKKYYEAGVNIVPSRPLGGIDTDTCNVDCMKKKLTMETEIGKWRGWQVSVYSYTPVLTTNSTFHINGHYANFYFSWSANHGYIISGIVQLKLIIKKKKYKLKKYDYPN